MATEAKRYAAFCFLAVTFLVVFFLKTPDWLPFSRHATDPLGNNGPSAAQSPIPNEAGRPSVESRPRNQGVKDASRKVVFPGFPIDINAAGRSELMMLPGIGEKTADRIIEKRLEKGGFTSTEDMLEVKGIGPGKYERVRGLITAGKDARGAKDPEGLRRKTR
ncbi:MAG: helix-hairpin-helix domain-containing protein [Deltaproteobacteria bacterium]|nr:helix-hairpin-helix domain-containing protein [Deltaproteobacteria bacterium]